MNSRLPHRKSSSYSAPTNQTTVPKDKTVKKRSKTASHLDSFPICHTNTKNKKPSTVQWNAVLKSASSDIRRLSYVNRYSSIPVLIKENTGEHQYYVAMYAMLIHRKLGRNLLIGEIDAHVMLHALTHDLSDSIGSDLVRILKYSSPEFTAAVHKAEESMVCKLDERILSLYRLANIHKDWYIEAVVKAADFMSLYEYMWREKNMGNKEIEPFFQRMVADMKMMQRKLLKEKVESEFNRYRLALADLYMAMGNGIFNQNFVTS